MKGDIRDYQSFDFLSEEEKHEQVYLDFWYSISESEVLDRDILNALVQIVEDVDSGKVKPVPFNPENFS